MLDSKGTPQPGATLAPTRTLTVAPALLLTLVLTRILTLTPGVDAISKLPTKQELMQDTAVAIKQVTPHLVWVRVRVRAKGRGMVRVWISSR